MPCRARGTAQFFEARLECREAMSNSDLIPKTKQKSSIKSPKRLFFWNSDNMSGRPCDSHEDSFS
jgi:hypothetical protein